MKMKTIQGAASDSWFRQSQSAHELWKAGLVKPRPAPKGMKVVTMIHDEIFLEAEEPKE